MSYGRYKSAALIDGTFTAAGTKRAAVAVPWTLRAGFSIRVSAQSAAAVAATLALYGSNTPLPTDINAVGALIDWVTLATAVVVPVSNAVAGIADYTGGQIAITTASTIPLQRSYKLVDPPENVIYVLDYTSGGGSSVRFELYGSMWGV